MGCGSGQPITRHLRERGFAVVGVDARRRSFRGAGADFPVRNGSWRTCAPRRFRAGLAVPAVPRIAGVVKHAAGNPARGRRTVRLAQRC